MTYDGPKSKPKPIAITWPALTEVERIRNQYYPDYYTSILGASLHTGISRNTISEALYTGEPIKKGKGKGCKVEYRNPEDKQILQQKHDEFQSKKQLAVFGLTSVTQALSEIERLRTIEKYCDSLRQIHTALIVENRDLLRLLKLHNIEVIKNAI